MSILGDTRSLTLADTQGFQTLTRYLDPEAGVDCNHFRPSFLRRRVSYRMLARSVTTYQAILAYCGRIPVNWMR